MSSTHPDRGTVHAALASAVRAPSVHNTQPWLWRVGDTTVHLYADTSRGLPYTDPDQRDLVLSCGAALHHFRAAARVFGWETSVHRLPNPADQDHLAAIEFRASGPTPEAVRLARAITQRRTDRRRYTSWEVADAHVAAMAAAGAANGALVRRVADGRERAQLLRAFEQAAWEHARDFSYGAELAQWSGRHATPEGVPARSTVAAEDATVRPFSNPGLPQAVIHDIDAVDCLLMVSTTGDDRISRLRAGEAAGAVLVTATTLGLATCPLTEPLELPATRDRIRTGVLDDSAFPQMIIRVGWAASSSGPVPETPRRALAEVVRPL
ncbi:Acg family FMN-binding oxidoreductase [Nocardia mexicana]|uniref:Nitroreductase family protein n=1 Tax=Nocardia mexicana TaxID=279262 RepID=A0A370HDD2_9NOCA|nr:NAD(P)H nitroreductase [Nocardia mexicana]RDI55238.1 nitroreductase family protein [Nocardia mexicana]